MLAIAPAAGYAGPRPLTASSGVTMHPPQMTLAHPARLPADTSRQIAMHHPLKGSAHPLDKKEKGGQSQTVSHNKHIKFIYDNNDEMEMDTYVGK